jgi:hypothetical protein
VPIARARELFPRNNSKFGGQFFSLFQTIQESQVPEDESKSINILCSCKNPAAIPLGLNVIRAIEWLRGEQENYGAVSFENEMSRSGEVALET